MKTKLLLLVLLTILVGNVAADDALNAQSEINAAQKKISHLAIQKKGLITKVDKWKADSAEAASKVIALQDKQKSPAYKSASKKVADLGNKIQTVQNEIKQIDKSVDSLSAIIVTFQQASAKQTLNVQEEVSTSDGGRSNDNQPVVDDNLELNRGTHKEEIGSTSSNDLYKSSSKEKTDEESLSSSSTSVFAKIWKFIKILFWIVVGIIALILGGKIVGHGGGSSRSSSRSSSNSGTNDWKKNRMREIESLKADIVHLQSQITRCRANMNNVNRKTEQKMIDSLKRQIADKKDKIASIKASL